MPTHSTAVMGTKYVRLRKISVSPLMSVHPLKLRRTLSMYVL